MNVHTHDAPRHAAQQAPLGASDALLADAGRAAALTGFWLPAASSAAAAAADDRPRPRADLLGGRKGAPQFCIRGWPSPGCAAAASPVPRRLLLPLLLPLARARSAAPGRPLAPTPVP
jgi:hypothetical protein